MPGLGGAEMEMGLSLDEWICAKLKCPAWRQEAKQAS